MRADTSSQDLDAHCENCNHWWTPARAPIALDVLARLLRALICPMCGADSKKLTVGQRPKS